MALERGHVLLLGLAGLAVYVASRRAPAASGATGTLPPVYPVIPGVYGNAGSYVVGGDPAGGVPVNDYCTQNPGDPICSGIVAIPLDPGSLTPGPAGGGDLPGSPTGPYLLTP